MQSGEKLDKIELAFRKFDKNQDGFLSKEEFGTVRVIRRRCNKVEKPQYGPSAAI